MRILYHPQLSMRSYADPPKWLIDSDAHLTKLKAYAAALPADWQWHVLMPETEQRIGAGLAVAEREVVEHRVSYMENVHQERFNFPMREYEAVLRAVAPDLILCEVPEHVGAWRALQGAVGSRCPVIAMVEHVEFYAETQAAAAGSTSFLRQLEGVLAASLTAFPLVGMLEEFHAHAVASAPSLCGDLRSKLTVWPGLFSAAETDHWRASGLKLQKQVAGTPVVFLISRLSDPTRTHYEQIIAGSNELLERGVAHRLWVANPNSAREWGWVRSAAKAYEAHPYGERVLARERYLQLLWASDVVPVMYDLSRIYSVGACEAAVAGNAVLSAPQRYPGPRVPTCEPDAGSIADALAELIAGQAKPGARDEMLQLHGVESNLEPVLASVEAVSG